MRHGIKNKTTWAISHRLDRLVMWHVYHVNCGDCKASFNHAWRRKEYKHFRRCPWCGRQLGFMDLMFLKTVKATTQIEAIKIGRKEFYT